MLLLLEINIGLTLVISLVVGALLWGVQTFLQNHIYICGPNEVLVFTGRSRTTSRGEVVGYRVLKGGRSSRTPFLEDCQRLSLVPLSIQCRETFVLAGGTKASFSIEAQVQISAAEPALDTAVMRFLGVGTDEIAAVAANSLKASLAEFLSRHDPKTAPPLREPLPVELMDCVRADLLALGLELRSLQLEAED